MRAALVLVALLAAMAALPGCEEEPDCDALDPADAWIEAGVGEQQFEPIEDGVVLAVERGSQGGMHVWVSLRAGGIAPGSEDIWEGIRNGDLPYIEILLSGPNGLLTPDNGRPTVLARGDDGEYLLLEQLTQFSHFEDLPDDWQDLDFGEVELDMEEQDHTLQVRLTDQCGTEVSDCVTVRFDFPPRPDAPGDDDDDDSADP